MIITAGYIFLVIGKVFFGELCPEYETLDDITPLDKVAVGVLSLAMIALGVLPSLMVPLVSSGVNRVMALLGGA